LSKALLRFSKVTAHLILVILSIFLSVNLFIQFSNRLFVQILFGSMAVALEAIKVYLLILSKTEWMVEGKRLFVVPKFIVYVGLAGISLLASVGFTLVSIEEQSQESVVGSQYVDRRIDLLEAEYQSNMAQIEIIQSNAKDLDYAAVERSEIASEQVRVLQSANRDIMDEIQGFYEEKYREETIDISSNDMFTLLGETIDIDGIDMRFYLMLFFVLFLEVSIAITAETVKPDDEANEALVDNSDEISTKRVDIESLYGYIEEYIDGFEEGRMDEDVSKETGIPVEECIRYREKLQSIHYKGRPMIDEKGRLSYRKENVKKIVQFHFDSLG
jgi:hypothetical protein